MTKKRGEVKPAALPHPNKLYKLLTRVASYYRQRFNEEPRAKRYLAERGITDDGVLTSFTAGYCDGTLHEVLPDDTEVRTDLARLGIIKDNGKELFRECVVFPLWDPTGLCVGLYGRRLFASEIRHLYLPGPQRGLIHWPKGVNGELVLTESVLDAVSLHQAGIGAALSCYGTGGFTCDHKALLDRLNPARVAICFDGDEAGVQAARELATRLQQQVSAVRVVSLPAGEDPNSLLVGQGHAYLRSLFESGSAPPFASAPAFKAEKSVGPLAGANHQAIETHAHGFVLHRDERRYEVKGIARQGTQLRVTVKASTGKGAEQRYELSTLDLYSGRSRQWFGAQVAEVLGASEEIVRSDLHALVDAAEAHEGKAHPAVEARVEMTDTAREDALALLARPSLLDDVLADYEAMGITGERTNKLLGYLVATSRKLETPLSLLIQSRSGAGKSALQDAILALVPEEDLFKYSRITDQALFYKCEDALVHKVLAIEEAAGMGGAAYSIRAMQSAKKLRIAATGKDPVSGKMQTEEYMVRGPVSVMLTTTQTDFDQETLSRFITVTVDESSEMTRQIHETQRYADTLEGILRKRTAERLCDKHHNAQRLLESVVVVNPYAPKLSFPTERLAARRDHVKYLGLIKAIAFVYQHQRQRRAITHEGEELCYIEVTLEDIARANAIAKAVLAGSSQDLTPQGRQLLGLIRKMLSNGCSHAVGQDGVGVFTRRFVREYSGWSDWQVRTHLGELVELEYLHLRVGKIGKEYLYEMGDGSEVIATHPAFGLTDVAALKAVLTSPAEPAAESSGRGAGCTMPRKSGTSGSSQTSRHLEGP